jgi:hypothetical protein
MQVFACKSKDRHLFAEMFSGNFYTGVLVPQEKKRALGIFVINKALVNVNAPK